MILKTITIFDYPTPMHPMRNYREAYKSYMNVSLTLWESEILSDIGIILGGFAPTRVQGDLNSRGNAPTRVKGDPKSRRTAPIRVKGDPKNE